MTSEIKPIIAVIIEDEPRNAEALRNLLTEFCEGVEVLAIAGDVEKGYKAVQEYKPDVVFLDIELPGASGFSLFDYFEDKPPFAVIFTTAYNDYAIKAFECAAMDYLTKPVEIKRLKGALQKVRERKLLLDTAAQAQFQSFKHSFAEGKIRKIALSTFDGIIFRNIDDIVRCEGDNNYTTFYFTDKTKLVISKTLKDFETLLNDSGFFRPHKSHLINLNKIKKYIKGKSSILVMEDGSEVDVSVRKKEELSKILPGI